MLFDVEKSVRDSIHLGNLAFERAMRRAEIDRALQDREQAIEDAKRLIVIRRRERALEVELLKESIHRSLSRRSFTRQGCFAQFDEAFDLFKQIRSLEKNERRRLLL